MNDEPRLTNYLVERRTFSQEPFVIVDAGALGGYESHWDHLQDQVRILAFEPGAGGESDRKSGGGKCQQMSCALGRENGTAVLKVYGHPAASSLYSANPCYWSRRTGGEMYQSVDERLVEVRRLDDVLAEEGIPYVDFIKLDVEGSELDVLMGAGNALQSSATFGIAFEFMLSPEAFLLAGRKCGTFVDIHQLLDQAGFELYDISTYRFARSMLPQPFAYHYVNTRGELFAGPTIRGQKTNGDAVYFRDLACRSVERDSPGATQVLKGACLLELYGLNDCAAELIHVRRDTIAQVEHVAGLLDLLVPPLKGARLSYSEYLDAYESDRRRFMPSRGFRSPDHTVHSFDGQFIPRQTYEPRQDSKPLMNLTRGFAAHGWRPATQQTAVYVKNDRIRIDTDHSRFSYQLVSATFETGPGADYVLSYDVETLKGGATVGVLDGDGGSWIAQMNLPPGRSAGHLHFVARGRRAQIVVANCSTAQKAASSVEIAQLGVWEAEKASH